jgi:hypothetical protein
MEKLKLISAEQNGINYDPDSSPQAWEHFKEIYTQSKCEIFAEFDTGNLIISKSKGYRRLLAPLKLDSDFKQKGKFWPKFKIGGDTDFNFNWKKEQDYIKLIDNDIELLDLLNSCCSLHHSLANFSIMPVSGKLNNFKGAVFDKYDRLDRFVYELSEYYLDKEKNRRILSMSGINEEPLENFLEVFREKRVRDGEEIDTSIYNYCQKIYFIDQKDFVNELIENGKQPIDTRENLKSYMELAHNYWKFRTKKWEILRN